jgi:topoisomerase-4 subunit B
VVNALAEELSIEVARDRTLWRQTYRRGKPTGKLRNEGPVQNRRGTTVTFSPDPEIFGAKAAFRPALLYRMARSKAYLFRGVELRWSCAPGLIAANDQTPQSAVLHFPGGLADFLDYSLDGRKTLTRRPFAGEAAFAGGEGKVEWAISWPLDGDGFLNSYCNTIPTSEGGSHELGLRTGVVRSLKAYAELIGNRRAAQITAEDVLGGACGILSVFTRDPQFQGQTKERLATPSVTRLVDGTIKDHFDHWLSGDPETARTLLDQVIERAEERLRRRRDRELSRKTATRRLRLPGKLADCARSTAEGTEIFIVEGDSAGGSAKQARNRETQAVLPLRGKILNVASASADKLQANQELADLVQALGCGTRGQCDPDKLRYDRVVVMTDADVDGAHIASLLMTFFFREMRPLIDDGRIYLALPPLYRLSQGAKTLYARDDAHKDELMATLDGRGKVEVSRFKGLGEMPAAQLRLTTMSPATRTLLQVRIEEPGDTAALVEQLMGRKAEARFTFIQERARFVEDLDV